MIIYFPMKICIYEKYEYFRSIIFKKINYSDSISAMLLKKKNPNVLKYELASYIKKRLQ